MPTVYITPEEKEALAFVIDLVLQDQSSYLSVGNPPLDYGEEWPEAARSKAQDFRVMAVVCQKLDWPTMANDCERLAIQLEESVAKEN